MVLHSAGNAIEAFGKHRLSELVGKGQFGERNFTFRSFEELRMKANSRAYQKVEVLVVARKGVELLVIIALAMDIHEPKVLVGF